MDQRSRALASLAPTITAAPRISASLYSKRRRRKSRATVVSPKPDPSTTVPEAPKPLMVDMSVQTDPLPPPPPPPETMDAEVDVFPETRNRRVQAVPCTCDIGSQTQHQEVDEAAGWEEPPAPFPPLSPSRIAKKNKSPQ